MPATLPATAPAPTTSSDAPARKAAASKPVAKKIAAKKPAVKRPAAKKAPASKVAAKTAKAPATPKPVAAPKAAAPKKVKHKLVRDSFTMPHDDFKLIDQLKERALGFKRPAKKSELLRAGLQALAGLSDAKLKAALDALAPLKPGRPRKDG
ncbi:MAG: hypothetical protein WAQ08_07980 [Aquabacterium sp.]|uniref:hypothetical protein n=1 Tax=Aquabacterium sp. TaxID=1872578 RepID=UPI003BAE9F42